MLDDAFGLDELLAAIGVVGQQTDGLATLLVGRGFERGNQRSRRLSAASKSFSLTS